MGTEAKTGAEVLASGDSSNIGNLFGAMFTDAKNGIGSMFSGLKKTWDKDGIGGVLSMLGGRLGQVIMMIVGGILSLLGGGKDIITNLIGSFIGNKETAENKPGTENSPEKTQNQTQQQQTKPQEKGTIASLTEFALSKTDILPDWAKSGIVSLVDAKTATPGTAGTQTEKQHQVS